MNKLTDRERCPSKNIQILIIGRVMAVELPGKYWRYHLGGRVEVSINLTAVRLMDTTS